MELSIKYSQFSLFAVVMVHDICVDTELADVEPLLLGDIQGTVHGSL